MNEAGLVKRCRQSTAARLTEVVTLANSIFKLHIFREENSASLPSDFHHSNENQNSSSHICGAKQSQQDENQAWRSEPKVPTRQPNKNHQQTWIHQRVYPAPVLYHNCLTAYTLS